MPYQSFRSASGAQAALARRFAAGGAGLTAPFRPSTAAPTQQPGLQPPAAPQAERFLDRSSGPVGSVNSGPFGSAPVPQQAPTVGDSSALGRGQGAGQDYVTLGAQAQRAPVVRWPPARIGGRDGAKG
jgi:hypothetical protein